MTEKYQLYGWEFVIVVAFLIAVAALIVALVWKPKGKSGHNGSNGLNGVNGVDGAAGPQTTPDPLTDHELYETSSLQFYDGATAITAEGLPLPASLILERTGGTVTMTIRGLSGTFADAAGSLSNTLTTVAGAVPAAFRPYTGKSAVFSGFWVLVNATTYVGRLTVSDAGTITIRTNTLLTTPTYHATTNSIQDISFCYTVMANA